jgi:glyoxylase I family protein
MDFKFHHVAISVSDIDVSREFYQQFGLSILKEYIHEDQSYKITQLNKGGFILELFWLKNFTHLPKHAKQISTDLRVLGTKHLGFQVNDLMAAVSELKQKGIYIESEPKIGRTGVMYAFFKDPDGILVEISEDKRDLS